MEIIQLNPKSKFKNYCLPEKHVFENGGREKLLEISGLSDKILKKIIDND